MTLRGQSDPKLGCLGIMGNAKSTRNTKNMEIPVTNEGK